jgi:hypothetical protein
MSSNTSKRSSAPTAPKGTIGQLVALASPLVDLARAAREDEHGLAGGQQGGAVLACAGHGARAAQEVAPDRHLEVEVIGHPANADAAALLEFTHERGEVLHPEQLVIADEHERSAARHVGDVEHHRARQPVRGVHEPPRGDRHRGGRDVEVGHS